jgi:hypothetical protein
MAWLTIFATSAQADSILRRKRLTPQYFAYFGFDLL